MKKILASIFIIATFLFLHPLIARAQDRKDQISENQALAIVIQKVKDDALYSAWAKIECLSFYTEEISENNIDIAIRENHKDNCLGDPDTAPIVDRFRILRLTKKLLWYNFVRMSLSITTPKIFVDKTLKFGR